MFLVELQGDAIKHDLQVYTTARSLVSRIYLFGVCWYFVGWLARQLDGCEDYGCMVHGPEPQMVTKAFVSQQIGVIHTQTEK